MKNSEERVICENIKAAAQGQHLSNVELANKSGVSYRLIWGIMNGQGKPRPRTIQLLARALGRTPADLGARGVAPIGDRMIIEEDRPVYDSGGHDEAEVMSIAETVAQLARLTNIPELELMKYVLDRMDKK